MGRNVGIKLVSLILAYSLLIQVDICITATGFTILLRGHNFLSHMTASMNLINRTLFCQQMLTSWAAYGAEVFKTYEKQTFINLQRWRWLQIY